MELLVRFAVQTAQRAVARGQEFPAGDDDAERG